jgi:hypothetical protein
LDPDPINSLVTTRPARWLNLNLHHLNSTSFSRPHPIPRPGSDTCRLLHFLFCLRLLPYFRIRCLSLTPHPAVPLSGCLESATAFSNPHNFLHLPSTDLHITLRAPAKMAGTRNYDFLVRCPFTTPQGSARDECLRSEMTDQTATHRRFRRWQIMLPTTIQRRLLHTLIHHHDRN